MKPCWPSIRPGALCAFLVTAAPGLAQGEDPSDLPVLLQKAQKKLLRNDLSSAEAAFEELLDAIGEEAEAARPVALLDAAQLGLWTIALRRGRYEEVRDGIRGADDRQREARDAVLLHAAALQRLGAYQAAAKLYEGLVGHDAGDLQARHEMGEALAADGQRAAAGALWQQNADAQPKDGRGLAFRGRSLWRLGGRKNLEAASASLVESMRVAPERPEARITYALVSFEAFGEGAGFQSGVRDLTKVLDEHGDDEEALLAMYRIRSANMARDGGKTERFLERVLDRNPRCVAGLLERAANVLDDRRYRDAAMLLDDVLAIDGNHRVALCHRAGAAWLLHDRDGYQGWRAKALAGDPGWPDCDRILGEHLCALYRFADALPFFTAANQVAPDDIPTLHGLAKALIYTGDGQGAKEQLLRAKTLAAGINDPWRHNALAAQQLLDEQYTVVEHGDFVVQMNRQDAEVLSAYLLPVQLSAAEVLGAKYQWRPTGKVKVEVFQKWDDFSVRTIGFRGFTALGACFGRLITLVSPVDADLRLQDFMWEATAWHEYTHVLTLGLSKHRVPRWLTEGFSVYEEKARDPTWERGMDRELFDAFHNRDIPPVHLLNRLFRGPRILFGYFQGGLIVEWIQQHLGFDKALALLAAFGDDLDTEEAFGKALGMPSSQFDRLFLEWVQKEKLRSMKLLPRLDDNGMQRRSLDAARDKTDLQARVELANACLLRDNPVDAGRWLAEVLRGHPDYGPALLVRAELFRARKDDAAATDCWRRGFAAGGEDFDARIAFGRHLLAQGDGDGAIEQWQRAKACWPGCTEQAQAPELLLAKLYRDRGDATQAQMEMKSYCRRTARAFQPRYTLAQFANEAGNREEELRYLVECNRIDPFHRELHVRMGEAYEALGKQPDAAREFEVAAAVLPSADRRYLQRGTTRPAADAPDELAERGALWLRAARLRRALGDAERAVELLTRIGKEAPGSAAAADAEALLPEWRGR